MPEEPMAPPGAMMDLAAHRLHAQKLVGEPLLSAVEVVRHLGAVQAQDYAGARWALGQRTAGATAAGIDRLFDEGRILRTHVMRPTWHFVLPEDIHWMLDLTGPKIRRALVHRQRYLGLDEDLIARATAAMSRALEGGQCLTRTELADVLRAAGISPDGQRMPHLLGAAELDGAIVSGPTRGKHLTFALLAERAPDARRLDRSEALELLARRYFLSHGPAQLQDFVWWSGLSVADARAGLTQAASQLERRVVNGKEYWLDPACASDLPAAPVAHLLPNWDEYTVGYRDREAAHPPNGSLDPGLFTYGNILSNVVTIGGKVRGGWRRVSGPGRVRIEIRLQKPLAPNEAAAVEAATHRLGEFLEVPAEIVWR
jgi:hypothetical protein